MSNQNTFRIYTNQLKNIKNKIPFSNQVRDFSLQNMFYFVLNYFELFGNFSLDSI